jgi:hypothetical protein
MICDRLGGPLAGRCDHGLGQPPKGLRGVGQFYEDRIASTKATAWQKTPDRPTRKRTQYRVPHEARVSPKAIPWIDGPYVSNSNGVVARSMNRVDPMRKSLGGWHGQAKRRHAGAR